MTTIEKLAWLQANTCLFSIEVNEQRSYYETVEQTFEEKGGRYKVMDPDVRAECIRRKQLVLVQCYPSTPIGFLCVAHYDLEQAVDAVYQAVKGDEHFTPYVVSA